MKTATRKVPRKKPKTRKPRKKRTTIKEAYNIGYKQGFEDCKKVLESSTTAVIEKMIEECNSDIEHYPRNTKFVELQLDAITELRQRLIYDEGDAPFRYLCPTKTERKD
jgi:dihydroneopterin aldolase